MSATPRTDALVDEFGIPDAKRLRAMNIRLVDLCRELEGLINSPEIHDFVEAVKREAAHQRERWGSEHDEGKTAEDWLWLVAYLSTKATQASRYSDRDKYLHHIITCAAACLNWHANAAGTDSAMRPGVTAARVGESPVKSNTR